MPAAAVFVKWIGPFFLMPARGETPAASYCILTPGLAGRTRMRRGLSTPRAKGIRAGELPPPASGSGVVFSRNYFVNVTGSISGRLPATTCRKRRN
jgi:hypothetical protein